MIEVNQVGKRWFIVTGKGISVEASYGIMEDWRDDWKRKRKWNLIGTGSKKNRDKIVGLLELTLGPISN